MYTKNGRVCARHNQKYVRDFKALGFEKRWPRLQGYDAFQSEKMQAGVLLGQGLRLVDMSMEGKRGMVRQLRRYVLELRTLNYPPRMIKDMLARVQAQINCKIEGLDGVAGLSRGFANNESFLSDVDKVWRDLIVGKFGKLRKQQRGRYGRRDTSS